MEDVLANIIIDVIALTLLTTLLIIGVGMLVITMLRRRKPVDTVRMTIIVMSDYKDTMDVINSITTPSSKAVDEISDALKLAAVQSTDKKGN